MLRSIKALFLASLLVFLAFPATVSAVSGSDWRAGNIISDNIFYNNYDMTVSEIQAFLNNKVSNCDTWGTKPSGKGGTRAEYGTSRGYPPPYTCLKDYFQHGKSSAQIIKEAADNHNVSVRTLLVLLQKEQSLVTDDWPWSIQYRSATGYGCPDTAPCDAQYYGFSNQVHKAAWQFRRYATYPGNYRYKPFQNNYIQYNPNAGCGGSNVYLENYATAGLYNYTPYQPNAATMSVGIGVEAPCGAYGNKNFWWNFNNWFGSTHKDPFVALDDPRWMQLKTNTYKKSVFSGSVFGPELLSGRQIYFPDKIFVNGQWYLRTQWDKDNNNMDGIALSDLTEIPIQSATPKWTSTTRQTRKIDPLRNKSYEYVDPMVTTKITDSVSVNGKLYYRTEYEKGLSRPRFIPADSLEDARFYDMIRARGLYAKNTLNKVDVFTGEVVGTVPAGNYAMYSKRITNNGTLYVQNIADSGTSFAVAFNDLYEVEELPFTRLDNPRAMKLGINTYKRHLPLEQDFGPELLSGRQIYFPDKIFVNGEWYLRTQWDKDNGNMDGIKLSDLTER